MATLFVASFRRRRRRLNALIEKEPRFMREAARLERSHERTLQFYNDLFLERIDELSRTGGTDYAGGRATTTLSQMHAIQVELATQQYHRALKRARARARRRILAERRGDAAHRSAPGDDN